MKDDIAQKFFCVFDYKAKKNTTRKQYEAFIKAIESHNSTQIHNSEVFKYLQKVLYPANNQSALKYNLTSGIVYRARTIDLEKDLGKESGIRIEGDYFHGFQEWESREPPVTISSEGRSNIRGVSYFYCAEDEYTALSELKPTSRGFASIAKFQITSNLLLVDFSENTHVPPAAEMVGGKLITAIMEEYLDTPGNYLFTQFISDEIRKAGYDGIRYISARSGGKNITIFNPNQQNLKFMESKVVFISPAMYRIVDLSASKELFESDDNQYYRQYNTEEINFLKKKFCDFCVEYNKRLQRQEDLRQSRDNV